MEDGPVSWFSWCGFGGASGGIGDKVGGEEDGKRQGWGGGGSQLGAGEADGGDDGSNRRRQIRKIWRRWRSRVRWVGDRRRASLGAKRSLDSLFCGV